MNKLHLLKPIATEPTLDEWRSLHDAAFRFQALAPWNWMEESDTFGIKDPETGELGFVSVMGAIGECFAMSLYLGTEALHLLMEIEHSQTPATPENILMIPQLMASFEDRDELENKDRKVLKRLGIVPKGENAFPMFRSHRPGYFPWFIEGGEARRLRVALEQAAAVVMRFKADNSLLRPKGKHRYFMRQQGADGAWEDSVANIPPPPPRQSRVALPADQVSAIKALPINGSAVELDFFMLPFPIGEKSERPSYSYAMMIVDAGQGFILYNEVVKAEPSREALWRQVPGVAARGLLSTGFRPFEVRVKNEMLHQALQPLAKGAGFKLVMTEALPTLDETRDGMFALMAR